MLNERCAICKTSSSSTLGLADVRSRRNVMVLIATNISDSACPETRTIRSTMGIQGTPTAGGHVLASLAWLVFRSAFGLL